MSLEVYIVCHNQESFDKAPKNKDFTYLIAGKTNPNITIEGYKNLNLCQTINNIENIPTLLTFTAWYSLIKNKLIKSDFVGIFEYDIDFLSNPYEIELEENTVYGFIKRELPDTMYLDCVPHFKNMLNEKYKELALKQSFWNATSNCIMPIDFLKHFVSWYMKFIPDILQYKSHAHFHERAINVFASYFGYKQKTVNLITHSQSNSHKITL